ncbi:MAG: phosphohistidine phosphatase SixA [Verrucomicrobiota bacterium]|nr:phosphohistidine phosphatase SixA [Verrucomicrobiota bacterium]
MKLYFLRHGDADWPKWNKPDDERPLTKRGKKEMKQVGRFLRDQKPKISLILSSPLPRALQTAEIAAEHLDVKLKEEPALAKGFNAQRLRQILKGRKAANVMLVGHEPDFSEVIAELTSGRVKLPKAGIALVDLSENASKGVLVWLIPPKIATG